MSRKIIFDNKEEEIIKSLIDNGTPLYKIAQQLNVSRAIITRFVSEKGIERKISNSEILKFRKPGYDELCRDIVNFYQNNFVTYQEVADKFHIGICVVLRLLHKFDVDIRKSYEYIRYNIDEHYFDVVDTVNKAYILGFLYADGNLAKDEYKIQLSLEEKDKEILEKIMNALQTQRPLYYRDNQTKGSSSKNQYRLAFTNKHMYQSLLNYGLHPNKSLTLSYPVNLNPKFNASFIRGLFDGDGCLHINKEKHCGKVSITSTESMVNSIRDIVAEQLGFIPKIYLAQNARKNPEKPTRVLCFGGNRQVKKFLDWMYDDDGLRLDRKYQKYLNFYVNKSLTA